MKTFSLSGKWNLKGKRQTEENAEILNLSATVPGCVQLDLSSAGLLPEDLYMGENIKAAESFEDYEWWYERTFICPENRKNVYLVFEGVECLAEYFLNGVLIGKSDNAFISHEFRIDEILKDGENTVSVHIKSATVFADSMDYPIRTLFSINAEGSYLRKPPHSFGWDIMPRAVIAGLWREVKLECRDDIYFTQAYAVTSPEENNFFYTLATDLNSVDGVEIELDCSLGDSRVKKRVAARKKFDRFQFTVNDPKLWFPYGYGEPNV